MPLLSIIVPVYNADKYLRECLDSILNQKFQDYECILVDDGSVDSSGAICEEYRQKDERIKVIHKENGGLVSARKAGIQKATGKYIGYVDADDFIHKEMYYEMCYKAIEKNADVVVAGICSFCVGNIVTTVDRPMFADGFYTKCDLQQKIYPKMLYNGAFFEFGLHPSLCNKIIKKSILQPIQLRVPNEITIGEDATCSYFAMSQAEAVYLCLSKGYYVYRMNSESMTHQIDLNRYKKIIHQLDYFWTQICENEEVLLREQFYYYAVYMMTNIVYDNLRLRRYFKWRKEIYSQYEKMCNSIVGQEVCRHKKEMDLPQQIEKYLLHMQYPNVITQVYAECGRIMSGLKRRLRRG